MRESRRFITIFYQLEFGLKLLFVEKTNAILHFCKVYFELFDLTSDSLYLTGHFNNKFETTLSLNFISCQINFQLSDAEIKNPLLTRGVSACFGEGETPKFNKYSFSIRLYSRAESFSRIHIFTCYPDTKAV